MITCFLLHSKVLLSMLFVVSLIQWLFLKLKFYRYELFTEWWYSWRKHIAPGKNEFSLYGFAFCDRLNLFRPCSVDFMDGGATDVPILRPIMILPTCRFRKRSLKNFFGSGVFGMGRSIYLKHEYFFSRPYMPPVPECHVRSVNWHEIS